MRDLDTSPARQVTSETYCCRVVLAEGRTVRAWVGRRAKRSAGTAKQSPSTCGIAQEREGRARLSEVAGVIHLAAKISLDARDEAAMLEVQVERGTAERGRGVLQQRACALIHVSSIHALDPFRAGERIGR